MRMKEGQCSLYLKNCTSTTRTWNTLEGIPFKYYTRTMLLNFSVWVGNGASNIATPLSNCPIWILSVGHDTQVSLLGLFLGCPVLARGKLLIGFAKNLWNVTKLVFLYFWSFETKPLIIFEFKTNKQFNPFLKYAWSFHQIVVLSTSEKKLIYLTLGSLNLAKGWELQLVKGFVIKCVLSVFKEIPSFRNDLARRGIKSMSVLFHDYSRYY
jgi:hypothetical protein